MNPDADDEDDITDTSRSPSYAISFPPVETLIPMFPPHDDDDTTSPYNCSRCHL